MGNKNRKGGKGVFAGPSQRQLKVGEVVRRTLSDIFLRGDLYDPELSRFNITVSEVRTSPDLRNATVYFLPLGGHDADVALKLLQKNKNAIRHQLTKSVELKFSPDLHFEIDRIFDNIEHTQKLLSDEKVQRDLGTDTDT